MSRTDKFETIWNFYSGSQDTHGRDKRFSELEQQLKFAESRCGTLKQQLDYIKLIYGGVYKSRSSNEKLSKTTNGERKYESSLETDVVQAIDLKSLCFGTMSEDFNMCLGVENSENQKSQSRGVGKFHCPYISKTPHSGQGSKFAFVKSKTNQQKDRDIHKTVHKKKKLLKPKSCVEVKNHTRKNYRNRNKCYDDSVVEIYKNVSVHPESESGLDDYDKNKSCLNKKVLNLKKDDELHPNVKPSELNKKAFNLKKDDELHPNVKPSELVHAINNRMDRKAVQSENENQSIHSQSDLKQISECNCSSIGHKVIQKMSNDRNLHDSVETKHNTLDYNSLKSSRKNIFTNKTFRNIPFVAAKSTAPSHNIGLNIQQVLSLIKKRQPLTNEIIYNNSRDITFELKKNDMESGAGDNNEHFKQENKEDGKKKKEQCTRSTLSYWQSSNENETVKNEVIQLKENSNGENDHFNQDLKFGIDRLKKVLIFLHDDFTNLSQKYKRLQRKLKERNLDKNEIKSEVEVIENLLQKREEEIRVIIALYREVLHLKSEIRKVKKQFEEKEQIHTDYLKVNTTSGVQMTLLLRQIQGFQGMLLKSK